MPITKPTHLKDGLWVVETSNGLKTFPDGETAEDFYLLNKHREEQKNGNSLSPRQ